MIGWIILLVGTFLFVAWCKRDDPFEAGAYSVLWVFIVGFFAVILLVVILPLSSPPTDINTAFETDEIYCISMPYESGSGDYILSYLDGSELKTIKKSPSSRNLHVLIGDKLGYKKTHGFYCVPYFHCLHTTIDHYITLPSLPETNASRCLW